MHIAFLRAACVALLVAPAAPAGAQMQHGSTPVAVEQAWARASLGRNGAAYATLVNRGGTEDRLVAARSEVADRVQLHTHRMDGTIMRMRPVEAVPLPGGASVTLKPGGYHLMMFGLKRKLAAGESFPLTLVFEKAGEIAVTVPVRKPGAMGPAMPHGKKHGGMGH